MTTRHQAARRGTLEALEPTETTATRKARAVILRTLEPLPPLDKLRVLGAVCVMLGQYGLAADILERLVAKGRR